MLGKSWSIALVGLDGHVVEVEADLGPGLPGLSITGLPDASLSEARDRIRAAVQNSGLEWPQKRITLNLSPASLPKRGSGFDLALAAAVLAAAGVVPPASLRGLLLLGELGLDGSVRPVPGVLPSVLRWSTVRDSRGVVVPTANLSEALLLPGSAAIGVSSLRGLVRVLREGWEGDAVPVGPARRVPDALPGDFTEVAGQPLGRKACTVAAAGGHNLLMTGTPGCGKTLLAERLPGILPPLSLEESLEVTAVHSVAGLLPADATLIERAPFQAPHHTATTASIVGGGNHLAKPGSASLAHRGILFVDEAPEFKRGVLDALRQPLEHGKVEITRVGGTATYPSRFSLVMAANPCPCAQPKSRCGCRSEVARTYLQRLSGPLLDRVDLQLELAPITRGEILADDGGVGESSTVLAARVAHAREVAARRYAGTPWRTNADVPGPVLRQRWPVSRGALRLAGDMMDKGLLTARGLTRVQAVAWTVADLADTGEPSEDDVAMALSLRLGDRFTHALTQGTAA